MGRNHNPGFLKNQTIPDKSVVIFLGINRIRLARKLCARDRPIDRSFQKKIDIEVRIIPLGRLVLRGQFETSPSLVLGAWLHATLLRLLAPVAVHTEDLPRFLAVLQDIHE